MDWQVALTISSVIISMITALGALIISYKVYQRQRSLENENHFFRYKMEQYHIIIQSASDLHDEYYKAFIEIKEEVNETFIDQNILNKQADLIDDKTDEFRLVLSKHCAFIPEEVVAKLDNFFNHLYEESQIMDSDEIKLERLDVVLDNLDKYENDLEDITNLMRKDLGIEAIDRRLKNRTHK
jgi:hypothetical protein